MKIIYLAGGNRLSTELKEEQVEFVELLGPKVSYHPQKEKDTETKQIDGALMLANQVTITGSIHCWLCFQEQACKFKKKLA